MTETHDPWANVFQTAMEGGWSVYYADEVNAARAAVERQHAAALAEKDALWRHAVQECTTATELLATLRASLATVEGERDRLREQMQFFVDAKPQTWDDPADFRLWVQSRARHLLTSPTQERTPAAVCRTCFGLGVGCPDCAEPPTPTGEKGPR